MTREGTRWLLAIGGAVVLHLVLLLFASRSTLPPPTTAPPQRPLVFTRVGLQSAPAAGSPSSAPAVAPRPARRRSDATPSMPPAPVVGEGPAPAEVGEASALPLAGATENGAESSGEGGGTGGSSTGAEPGEVVVASPREDHSAAMHALLMRAAERCYPSAARRFRQSGVVEVRFCVGAGGVVASTELVRGSGAPLLDGAATRCVVPGAAPFPAAAAGRCFELPVRFGAAP